MGKTLKILGYIFAVYLVLGVLINLFNQVHSSGSGCRDQLAGDVTGQKWHQRHWISNSQKQEFCTIYTTFNETCGMANEDREQAIASLRMSRYPWRELYRHLAEESLPTIGFLVDSLSAIATVEGLSRVDLAEMVVTFVQDIPYSYLLPGDCESFETGDKPCIGNIALGIYSPYEFLHTLHGDCDTRSVLLYAVLQEMGYDPRIMISDQYAHAMIAMNLPSSGDYIVDQGEKYYFWETTAKGWPLGMLPPSINNKDYWKIALSNEL